MSDALLELVTGAMGSVWVYPVLAVLAALDALVPLVPSETAVVTAGVFAAHDGPRLPLVATAAALGAFAGDHAAYLVGRCCGPRVLASRRTGDRGRRAAAVAASVLASRGPLVLVVARYVPGGRTAVTVTAGTVRYPLRRFTPFAALAAVTWGTYCALVGYLGGVAFERDSLKGVLLGVGLALGVTAALELTRWLVTRGRAHPQAGSGGSRPVPVAASPSGEDR